MSSDQQKPQIMKMRKKLKQFLLTLKQKKITNNNKSTNVHMDKPIIQKQEMIQGILSLSQKFVRRL